MEVPVRYRPVLPSTFLLFVLLMSLSSCKNPPEAKPGESPQAEEKGSPEEGEDAAATPEPSQEPPEDPKAQPPAEEVPSQPEEANALEVPEGFVQASPRQTELLKLAMQNVAADELDAAVMTLLTLADEGPASLEQMVGLLVLAEIYMMEEKPEKGLKQLLKRRDRFPANAELEVAIGQLQVNAGQNDEAIASLMRALELEPARLEISAALVALVSQKDDPELLSKAQKMHERALSASIELLKDPRTDAEVLVAILESATMVQDPRLLEVYGALLSHEEVAVVALSLEALVNAANPPVVLPLVRAARESEERELVQQGLDEAIKYLEQAQGAAEQ